MCFRRGLFFFFRLLASIVLGALATTTAQTNEDPPVTPLLKCWSRSSEISADAGIAADDANVYFVAGKGKLNAVDIKTGEIVWLSDIGGSIPTSILASGNAVYAVSVADADSYGKARTAVIRSINRVSGITNWSAELPSAERYYLGETVAGITVVASNGNLITLRPSDGVHVWKTLFTGELSATPDIGPTLVTIGVAGKKIEVFTPLEAKQLIRIKSDSATIATAIMGVAIYADERGEVFSVDVSDSGRNWSFKSGGKITDITLVGDKILISSADNFIYLMSSGNGHVVWKRRMAGRIANVSLVAKDQAAVTVVGERSAFVLEIEKGRIANQINLENEDLFLGTPIRASGKYILVATGNGVSAYSSVCGPPKPVAAK